jgi:diguanylate cyclase (GGDEF)-like protein
MKKILLLSFLAIQLILIIAIPFFTNSPVLSDFLTVIFDFTIFLILAIKTFKVVFSRIHWALMTSAIFFWLLADGIWLIMNMLQLGDPNESGLLALIYLVPNLFLTALVIHYFITNIHRWHVYQLLLDIFATCSLIYIMLNNTLAINSTLPQLTLENFVSVYGYIVTDLIILLVIITTYASFRNQRLTISHKFIMAGLILFVLSDLYFSYIFIADTYEPYSFVDYLFYLSFILLAASAVYSQSGDDLNPIRDPHVSIENRGKTWVILVFGTLIFLHTFFNKGRIESHFFILLTVLIHELLSKYMQTSILTSLLLTQEKTLTQNLEETVRSRTADLMTANEKLYYQVITDGLTGLNNRFFFINAIEKSIIKNEPFTILYTNLDRFKIINDLHGHTTGDQVLIQVAERLKYMHCPLCETSRIGGDEFGVIFHSVDHNSLKEISSRIFQLFEKDILVDGYRFNLSISIGVSRYPQDASTADELLKFSNLCMYQAKNSNSKCSISIFDTDLIAATTRRNQIEWQLKRINFDQEFYLHYQPQFRSNNKELIGVEALIRWKNPELGFVSPAEFIPITEEIGMIVPLTNWVMKEAMAMILPLNQRLPNPIKISINISPLSFDYVDFFPSLTQKIHDKQIDPHMICLEITEHSAMSTATQMEEVFTVLNGMGFEISIDDFGTGYSSLSYLRRFDIDQLKIAKELVDNIVTDYEDRLIVKAIILMAQGIGLQTVAEGVETEEQLHILIDLNCDIIQGYFWGRPVNKETFVDLYLTSH